MVKGIKRGGTLKNTILPPIKRKVNETKVINQQEAKTDEHNTHNAHSFC